MRLQRSSGLVGHWKFNEKSGIIANDSSRYRNTGTLVGATHLPVWADKGIKFDGVDDYVDCGNNASLNITNAITVEAWVKPSTTTGEKFILSKGSQKYALEQNVGKFRSIIYNNSYTYLTSTTSYISGNWYHVVLTYDRVNEKIYINGILENSLSQTDAIQTTVSSLQIGALTSALFFSGSIDEVRIYNRALSAAEIKRHYEATKHNYI